MSDTIETITNDDETARVRIVHDSDADIPYDDGSSPIVIVNVSGPARPEQVRHRTSYEVNGDILAAAEKWADDLDTFERYLRMFHGTTAIRRYDTRDAAYVTFDTAHWREVMGLTAEHMARHPEIDWPASLANMDEYVAYLEGETYGWIAERLETWTNERTGETRQSWEHVDSCFGFYGLTDYLRDEAREALKMAEGDA